MLTALYDREALHRLHHERSGQPPAFTRFLRTLDLEAVLGEEMALEVQQQHGLREKRRAKA